MPQVLMSHFSGPSLTSAAAQVAAPAHLVLAASMPLEAQIVWLSSLCAQAFSTWRDLTWPVHECFFNFPRLILQPIR